MKVSISWRGRVLVAVLTGEIDTIDSEGLGEALDEVARTDATGVVLDFTGVTYIASMGIGMMLRLAKDLRVRGMRARIAGPSPAARTILDTLRIGSTIPIDATVEEAAKNLAPVTVAQV
jgi:anti-sigma B factor antagonist